MKGNVRYNDMIANIMRIFTLDTWVGVKRSFFSFQVAYKINGHNHASKYSALLHTLEPWVGSKGQFIVLKVM